MKEPAYTLTIYTDDTDCFGLVYHANYLKYFSRARTQKMAENGLSLIELQQQNIIFPVHHVDIEFSLPAKLGDEIRVHSQIEKLGKASVIFKHQVYKKNQQSNQFDSQICHGTVTLACVDNNLKLCRIPKNVYEEFARW